MVTIPREEYDRLRAAAEDLADLQLNDHAKAALAAGEDEMIPAEYVNRLLDGESAFARLPGPARDDASRPGRKSERGPGDRG
jgi:hypothetical protein